MCRRVSEWLAATLEMWCRVTGCGFESRALRYRRHGENCRRHFRIALHPDFNQFIATLPKHIDSGQRFLQLFGPRVGYFGAIEMDPAQDFAVFKMSQT